EPTGYMPREPAGGGYGARPNAMVEPTYRPPMPGAASTPPFSAGGAGALSPSSAGPSGSGSFGGARKTGPVENFRDGGGPDLEDEGPPLSSRMPPGEISGDDDDEYDGIP